MSWKGFNSVVFSVLVLASILFVSAQSQTTLNQKIEPKVLTDLRAEGKVTFFVVLDEQADTSIALDIVDWKDRGELVVDGLKEVADRTQQPILELLSKAGAEATPFWIVNAIKVITSSEPLIKDLAARPDVAYIKADEMWRIPEPIPGSEEPKVQAVEWGVAKVHAPEVWQQFNVRGEGIVVANIDTGVQYNHPALVMQYRGRRSDGTFDHNYNWYDPSRVCGNPSLVPCDNNGHGTHTMGTMVGDDGDSNKIGVAPGAKWIAAKGCEDISCSTDALLRSGEWVLAPTDLNGQNPQTDLRPNVVNNSWGGGISNPFYQMVVRNWRNAGIFPAFASGNPGSGCGNANVPGAYPESFAVGATDINDSIASFSGRGPATAFDNIVKPNISAPGVNIRSSFPSNGYSNLSGTSMATPHVAGVVALVWAASPALKGNISATFDLLQSTARARASTQCGPAGPPNNVYGWGIVDVLAAVQQVRSGGTLQGRVTDASRGTPIANAEVRATGPMTRTTNTNSEGNYSMTLAAGTYRVTLTAFGYKPQTINGVQIKERETTPLNFSAQPTPRRKVSGVVSSSLDQQPLANVEVKILNTPLPPVRTNASGYYEFPANVSEGTYDIQAGSGGCLMPATRQVNVSADVEVNFSLDSKVDNFGYACSDNIALSWIPGVDLLPLFGDDESISVNLPFPFSFYGQTYNTIYVSTNGFANFLENRVDWINVCVPNTILPAAIYALWDDLLVFAGSGVFTRTEGTAPDRLFVIEWRDVTFYGRPASSVATFEIILVESTGAIVLQYDRTDGDGNGSRATIGIENQDGTIGLQFSCNESAVSVGKTIVFFPPQ